MTTMPAPAPIPAMAPVDSGGCGVAEGDDVDVLEDGAVEILVDVGDA
jgi:hypothetical protein